MDARPLQRRTLTAALVAVSLALGACACRQPAQPVAESEMAPTPGKVTDLTAFERFIAGQPTPEQFRAHIVAEVAKWKRLVAEVGIKAE